MRGRHSCCRRWNVATMFAIEAIEIHHGIPGYWASTTPKGRRKVVHTRYIRSGPTSGVFAARNGHVNQIGAGYFSRGHALSRSAGAVMGFMLVLVVVNGARGFSLRYALCNG